MISVTDFASLQSALTDKEPQIQVEGDIGITAQLVVDYQVAVSSAGTGQDSAYTLKKDAAYFGVMFRVQNGGELILENLILDGDKENHPAENTGGRSLILLQGGIVRLQAGVHIKDNNSYQEGGGVYLAGIAGKTSQLYLSKDASITGCASRTTGGGIMAALRTQGDLVELSGQVSIADNRGTSGGGIYVRSYVRGVSGSLSIADQVHITGNTATATGGGVDFSGFRDGGSTPGAFELKGEAQVRDNRAVHGGGIYFYGANQGDRFLMEKDAVVSDNISTGNGGGICVLSPKAAGDFTVLGGKILNNQGGTGGGVYILSDFGGSFTFKDGLLGGNRAGNGASGSGGGFWFQNRSADGPAVAAIENYTIEGNEASAQGGGASFTSGPGAFTLQVSDSSISRNISSGNGGGLIVGSSGGAETEIKDSRIYGNVSKGFGGGFYFSNTAAVSGTIRLEGTQVRENTAYTEGGGLRFTSGQGSLQTTLVDCQVDGNQAETSSGGGIWNGGTNDLLTIRGETRISGNASLGGNGGGIYFNSDSGEVLLEGEVLIEKNQAGSQESSTGGRGGGICVTPGRVILREGVEIADNKAVRGGGGISGAESSMITMEAGNISGNDGEKYGGGVYLTNAKMEFIGGGIDGNSAGIGGGIYSDASSELTIYSGAQLGREKVNMARAYAPGIYNEGMLWLEGEEELSNGLYLAAREAVARILEPLAQGSLIQLDNTAYVAPNREGTPIVIAEATDGYPQLKQGDADAFRKPPAGFDGWEIRLNDNSTQILLAPILYHISYENLMGAQHSNPCTYMITTPDILLSPPSPVLGYRFLGWYDAPEGGRQVTEILKGSKGNRVFYARWEIVNYTITYCGNDQCGAPAKCVPCPTQVQEGRPFHLSAEIPCRRGYCFTGWNTQPDGSGTQCEPGQVIESLTRDTKLYAQWKRKFFGFYRMFRMSCICLISFF